ncbi:killer cell lectin-like receptor subfamily B member 1A [Arvicola amphibius]|uniref:killer cell lectin-like receptor subfamily B member 1A n=1 Tax=Arvicola amphibius TaxID=1047088 RepID=UPI001C081AD8|nr:killer cell lectin-like receptor subfamily B member 1A [Arvicola amphibius]
MNVGSLQDPRGPCEQVASSQSSGSPAGPEHGHPRSPGGSRVVAIPPCGSVSHLPFAMGTPRVCYSLKTSTTPGPPCASPPSRPTGACRCPCSHRLALKLSCAGLILLLLTVVGLSVLVRVLIQKPPVGNCREYIQENITELTGNPAKLQCPKDWLLHQEKCIRFSGDSNIWKEGRSDCAARGATLLLIQDQEELRFIKDSIEKKGNSFWIGLNYSLPEKHWRWINGSTLSSDVFQITGEAKTNSCASISKDKVVSEDCASDNYWICQKEPKHVSETRFNDS